MESSLRISADALRQLLSPLGPFLRQPLVIEWDGLELGHAYGLDATGCSVSHGVDCRRTPWPGLPDRIARLDLAAPPPGGGRMIVAHRR